MRRLASELGFAFRSLTRKPSFAITAIATIALGIGATAAIFSVVNAVLLRPLPYLEADRLALIWSDLRARDVQDFPLPPGDMADLRREGTLFSEVAALTPFRATIGRTEGNPEFVHAAQVTTNFFATLGAKMVLGRDFAPEDGTPNPPQAAPQPGAPQAAPQAPPPPIVTILSHRLWQRRYGGDPTIIGRTIPLFGNAQGVVVGVLDPSFELLFPPNAEVERVPDLWSAMRVDWDNGSRVNVSLRVIARLKPGVTDAQAQSQLDGIVAGLRERFPVKKTADVHWRLEPMQEDLVADVRPAIVTLMGAVVFVLLIACANVANLLLVRASGRERELAVRAAVGAGRWRLIRQMLLESLVLATAGGALGLGLARLGISLLVLLRPANLPRLDSIAIDPLVIVFTIAATVGAALLFGVVPAIRASRPDLMEVLRNGRPSLRGAGGLLVNGTVVTEVALSFMLLIGSGLMVRSFVALTKADPGFDPNNLLTLLMSGRPGNAAQQDAFVATMRERLGAIPGVVAVSATSNLPLESEPGSARYGTEAAVADPSLFQQASVVFVQHGYFETMRTRLIEGRTFIPGDVNDSSLQVVVDSRLATKAFPGQTAIGKRILLRLGGDQPDRFTIIGVVAHQRTVSLAADGRETIYLPGSGGRWVIRTDRDPSLLAGAVKAEIGKVDPTLAVTEIQPMAALVDRARAPTRFALVLIGVFAAIAMILAAVGLAGVLWTAVRQRSAEIGVRLALGASPTSILRLVIGQGFRLSVAGVAIGVVGAIAIGKVMRSMLVGVTPTDPITFVAIGALLLGVAALASWLPARQAAAVDPVAVLRDE